MQSIRRTAKVVGEVHSNSYAAWLKMGSPQKPTAAQEAALGRASELRPLRPTRQFTIGRDGIVTEAFELPQKSVSFVTIAW